jgi:hypothetical protein
VGRGSPGEPESDEEDAYKVRSQSGTLLDAEDCAWHAYDSESGGVDVYPIETSNEMPVLSLAKDRAGNWKLVSVSYGDADDYNPNAE